MSTATIDLYRQQSTVVYYMNIVKYYSSFDGSSFGASVTTHSAVVNRDAIPAASTRAVLTTYKYHCTCTHHISSSNQFDSDIHVDLFQCCSNQSNQFAVDFWTRYVH